MSTQNFTLPDVGEGLTEAEIVAWKVAPGDTVAINDVLCEIETAKSLVELPSPHAGVVGELLAEEGTTVEVGTPIITFVTDVRDGARSFMLRSCASLMFGTRRPRGVAAARPRGASVQPSVRCAPPSA